MTSKTNDLPQAPSGLSALFRWYASPVGMAFALGLATAAILALVGRLAIGLLVLVVTIAAVLPWKMVRLHQELEETRARSEAQRHIIETHITELGEQLSGTVSDAQLRATADGFRSADRKRFLGIVERLEQLERVALTMSDTSDETA